MEQMIRQTTSATVVKSAEVVDHVPQYALIIYAMILLHSLWPPPTDGVNLDEGIDD